MFKFLLSGVASLVTFFAATGVGTNSIWLLYEPDAPKSLKSKVC